MNSLGEERFVLEKIHRYCMMLYVPLVIIIVIMGAKFSYIVGQSDMYTSPTTVADHWEACIIQPGLVTLPIAEGANVTKLDLKSCLLKQPICFTTDGFNCLIEGVLPCTAGISTPTDPQLPMGQFGQAITAVGLQAIIFSVGKYYYLYYSKFTFNYLYILIVSHGALSRALRHPSWLPATIALLCWTTFAIFTYYTINPVLPVPNTTNATLFVILHYLADKDAFTGMYKYIFVIIYC